MGVRRILGRISPNLPEKFLFDFFLQIFFHKDHEDLFGVTSNKGLHVFFCKRWTTLFPRSSGIVTGFSGILPRFLRNQNFWGCACTSFTLVSYTTSGFPEFGLGFCGVADFLKTCGLLNFGLVSYESCLFFGLVFCRFLFCGVLFSNFMAFLLFQSIYCITQFGRVFV